MIAPNIFDGIGLNMLLTLYFGGGPSLFGTMLDNLQDIVRISMCDRCDEGVYA